MVQPASCYLLYSRSTGQSRRKDKEETMRYQQGFGSQAQKCHANKAKKTNCRPSPHAGPYLFLPVFHHVLELGELLFLIGFDALGFVSEPVGVILFQAFDGLLLLLL